MIIKDMTITNSRGDSITFGRFFRLYEDFDMSGLSATVNYTDSTADGSNYQNTKINNRDFDIPFFIYRDYQDSAWIEEQRKLAYTVFNPKANPFRIDITTKGDKEYFINANLEGSPSFPLGFDDCNRAWQKGLLQFSCNDPFFYHKDSKTVDIALWIAAFEFPLEIPRDEGIEMGYRSDSLIANVVNDGQETTGMIIQFKALGTLTNPSLFNMDTREQIKINTPMGAGDIIEVSTYQRRKYVKMLKNDGQEINLFNQLDFGSKFLQLDVGDNYFRYDADTNIDNLEVSMTFHPRYLGV